MHCSWLREAISEMDTRGAFSMGFFSFNNNVLCCVVMQYWNFDKIANILLLSTGKFSEDKKGKLLTVFFVICRNGAIGSRSQFLGFLCFLSVRHHVNGG